MDTPNKINGQFKFDGGAASFLGTLIISTIITILSLGLLFPFAYCMRQRWIAHHTMINGRRLKFNGSGFGLIGNWIVWLLLCIITIGIYSFWVIPKFIKWQVENTSFE
jgi:uncharacterized membrane protein YjgN (DUF898 family)